MYPNNIYIETNYELSFMRENDLLTFIALGENTRNESRVILPKPLADLIGDRVKQNEDANAYSSIDATENDIRDSEEDSNDSYDNTLNVESKVGNSMDKTHEMPSENENENESSFDPDIDGRDSTEETTGNHRTDEVISKSEYDARRIEDKKYMSHEQKADEVNIKESSSIDSEDCLDSGDCSSDNENQLDEHKPRALDQKGYRTIRNKKKSRKRKNKRKNKRRTKKRKNRGTGQGKKGYRQIAEPYHWQSEEAYEKQYKVECDMNMKERPEAYSDKTPHHSSSVGHQMIREMKKGLHSYLKTNYEADRGEVFT